MFVHILVDMCLTDSLTPAAASAVHRALRPISHKPSVTIAQDVPGRIFRWAPRQAPGEHRTQGSTESPHWPWGCAQGSILDSDPDSES